MSKPVYYSQYDEPYAIYPYPSANHPQANIKSSGCGVTCFAMVHATLLNSKYTPIDGAKDAISMNDRGLEGTEDEYYSHMAKKYKLPFEQTTSLKTAIEALKAGKLVVCRMKDWFRPGAGHFILAWGITGGKVQINDPASRANTGKLYDQSVFSQKCIRYFIFSKPEEAVKVLEVPEITGEQAVQILYDNKVIDSPDYWLNAIKVVKYLDLLLIKIVKSYDLKG